MYDVHGQCGCWKHLGLRRYHWHRVFDDGEIDPLPFGQTWSASIYGMAYEARKILYYFRVDMQAGNVEECGYCRCTH